MPWHLSTLPTHQLNALNAILLKGKIEQSSVILFGKEPGAVKSQFSKELLTITEGTLQ